MRLKLVVVFLAGAVLPACSGGERDGDKPPEAPRPREAPEGPAVAGGLRDARLAPVVVAKAGRLLRVPVALTNPTDGEVRYAVGGDGTRLLNLWGRLYRDGKEVDGARMMSDEPRLQADQIRRLKPNESALLDYRLVYTETRSGLYELRLTYEVPPKSVWEVKHGLTPMKLEQTILLDVRAE